MCRCLGEAAPLGGGDDMDPRGDFSGPAAAADGVAGSGTLEGESGVDESEDVRGAMAAAESGAGLDAAAFFSLAADAVSNAACRRARGMEGVWFSFAAGALLPGAGVDGSVDDTADLLEDGAGVLAGVVVMDVDLVATGPIASLSSPNSFHSSTCSRS